MHQGEKQARNYALDLLRIFSMLMIVYLHSASHGSRNVFFEISSLSGLALMLINAFSMVAVNVYVLISAYFLSVQKFKLSRILKIALCVVFYCLVVLIFRSVYGSPLRLQEILQLIFPVSYKTYWFATVYIGICFLSPVLNYLLGMLNKKQHFVLMLCSLVVCSVLRDALIISDPFGINEGYSLTWFVNVYIIGSFLRHHVEFKKVKWPFLRYVIWCGLMLLSWVVLRILGSRSEVVNELNIEAYYLRYSSTLNIAASVMLFVAFAKKTIQNKFFRKVIAVCSPLTFDVYLLHDNPFMRSIVWFDFVKIDALNNSAWLIPQMLMCVLLVFFAGLLIGFLRQKLFGIWENKEGYKRLLRKVDSLTDLFMQS